MPRIPLVLIAALVLTVGALVGRAWPSAARGAAVAAASPAPVGEHVILLNTGPIDTDTPAAKAARRPVGMFDGARMHLVQFNGSVQPAWYDALTKTGVQIVTYIPDNAYLVYGDAQALADVQTWAAQSPFVQWDGEYLPAYRIQPDPRVSDGKLTQAGDDLYAVQLFYDAARNQTTLALIDQLRLEPVKTQYRILNYLNLVVRLPNDAIAELAKRPDVVSVRVYLTPRRRDERQDRIVAGQLTGSAPTAGNYLTWLASKGLGPATFDFAVDVTDSGIDDGTVLPNHFGLYPLGVLGAASRVIYNRLEGKANGNSTVQGCDGHGTLNAHIIGGYVPDTLLADPVHADASGFRYGLGVAPFVKVGSSVIFDPDTFTFPNYPALQARAYNDGAQVSSNSWGADNAGGYDTDAQAYDALVRDAQPAGTDYPTAGNQEMVIVFAAGNAGPNAQTVGSPGTAKNVITAGASEGVQAFGGADACATTDAEADSADDMANFSSRGPTADGRRKPDLVAPGTHISGGVFQAEAIATGTGQAATCFDGSGVCAGPSSSLYFPLGQQFYTASTGTSHSTPAIAGAAALVRQAFLNAGRSAPSAAMTKAVLMNAASFMTGSGANDSLWSNSQGLGRLNLDQTFDRLAAPTILRDELNGDMFTASSQVRVWTGTISDASRPFRVTLAWTDPPGPTTGAAYVNNLDLEVDVNGQTYRGNNFSGATSVTGGVADGRNNVESVFLPTGTSGAFVVRVKATNIAGDGVPGVGGPLDQDFALVVANAVAVNQPVITTAGATLLAESCPPANNVLDRGETVTVSFAVQNTGVADTSALVATLLPSGGVTAPSGPQTYGALTAGGAAVSRPFTFTVDPQAVCGGQVVATLQLQDGATTLGLVSYGFAIGRPATVLTESFDGVTAPNLPTGWTAAVLNGATTAWQTATTSADTAPNALFAGDPNRVSDSVVTSPSIAISIANGVLTFRHSFNTEASPASASVGYDGGVLEIQLGAAQFQDILAAGGSFAQNGYNRTIATGFGSALAGRQAWSGDSGGYVTTVVNLPAAANGQTVRLRWRMASDSSRGGTGWRVDTVSVVGAYACCTSVGPTFTPTSTLSPTLAPTMTATGTATATPTITSTPIASATATATGTATATPTVPITPSPSPSTTATGTGTVTLTPGATLSATVSPTPTATGVATATPTPTATASATPTRTPTPTATGTATATATPTATPTRRAKTTGVYRPSNGHLYLKNQNTTGFADVELVYGMPGDRGLGGDWDGDGVDTIGVFRQGMFLLRNSNITGVADLSFAFGIATDLPVVGDWNGDGVVTAGVYRNGIFFLRNSNASGAPDMMLNLGMPGDVPIAGDWTRQGFATVGVFRPSNGALYLRNSNTTGVADITAGYGSPNDKPVVGDWDGNGTTTIGVYRQGLFYLRNSNTTGVADITFALGSAGDEPIAGDWDGQP